MNEDILKGKWRQVKGDLKKWWGRLTDDDLRQIEGSREKLAGLLQERYGYSRQEAYQRIVEFLEVIEEKLPMQMSK